MWLFIEFISLARTIVTVNSIRMVSTHSLTHTHILSIPLYLRIRICGICLSLWVWPTANCTRKNAFRSIKSNEEANGIAILCGIFELRVGIQSAGYTWNKYIIFMITWNRMQRTGMQNKVITIECAIDCDANRSENIRNDNFRSHTFAIRLWGTQGNMSKINKFAHTGANTSHTHTHTDTHSRNSESKNIDAKWKGERRRRRIWSEERQTKIKTKWQSIFVYDSKREHISISAKFADRRRTKQKKMKETR